MMQSESELMEGSDICVREGDYKAISCEEVQYDYSTLSRAMQEQARLLEQLLLH